MTKKMKRKHLIVFQYFQLCPNHLVLLSFFFVSSSLVHALHRIVDGSYMNLMVLITKIVFIKALKNKVDYMALELLQP